MVDGKWCKHKEIKSYEGEDHLDKQPGRCHRNQQPPGKKYAKRGRCTLWIAPFVETMLALEFAEDIETVDKNFCVISSMSAMYSSQSKSSGPTLSIARSTQPRVPYWVTRSVKVFAVPSLFSDCVRVSLTSSTVDGCQRRYNTFTKTKSILWISGNPASRVEKSHNHTGNLTEYQERKVEDHIAHALRWILPTRYVAQFHE
jgi:hypothetical protein